MGAPGLDFETWEATDLQILDRSPRSILQQRREAPSTTTAAAIASSTTIVTGCALIAARLRQPPASRNARFSTCR